MQRFVSILTILTLSSLIAVPLTAQNGPAFVVIAHPDVPAESISKKRVSQLLLREVSRWEGGLSAQPVDQESHSAVRNSFSRQVHGRSVESIKNYWLRQIFSGNGEPPPEMADDNAVIAFVKSHPGGIGYVTKRTRLSGVKVLDVAM
ncbi:MAG: hypothetical protein AAF657_12965 [Acidobacteriota bacterium]